MRWFLIVLAALTLVLAGTACGGDDESASDTTTITDSIDDTTDETTTDEETTTDGETTTDEETDTDSSDGFASDECEDLAASSEEIGEVLSGASSSDEIEEATDRFQELVDQAPEEIQDDLQVLADVYEQYGEVFADLDLDAGETPTPEQAQELTAALSSIDQEAVTEATTNLATWSTENC